MKNAKYQKAFVIPLLMSLECFCKFTAKNNVVTMETTHCGLLIDYTYNESNDREHPKSTVKKEKENF